MTGSHSRREASQGRREGGGGDGGPGRRWRTSSGGAARTRRGFQLDPTTPNGADITREEPGKKELEPSVKC